jgi:hypothetical protein
MKFYIKNILYEKKLVDCSFTKHSCIYIYIYIYTVMHKTGFCLQLLGLRGDPRWQSRELAPGLTRGQLLAQG